KKPRSSVPLQTRSGGGSPASASERMSVISPLALFPTTTTSTPSGRRRSATSRLSASSRGPSATAQSTSALGGGVGTEILVTTGGAVGRGAGGAGLAAAVGARFGLEAPSVGGVGAGAELHAGNRSISKSIHRRKVVAIYTCRSPRLSCQAVIPRHTAI